MTKLSSLLDALKARRETVFLWLKKNHSSVVKENKHLSQNGEARAYWHYGYLMATSDFIKKVEQLDTPSEKGSSEEAKAISSQNPNSSTNWKAILFVIILVLAAIVGSYSLGQYRAGVTADARLMELINESERLHTEVEKTRNQYSDAVSAIQGLSDENTHLIDLVADLRVKADKPPVIKEIVITRTVIKPSEPIYITPDLPEDYRFTLEPGLEVARFSQQDGKFSFETRELSVRNSIVIGEDKSTALLQIASSAEPDKYYEIPIDEFEVRTINKDKKKVKPDLSLAIRAGLNETPQLTASLGLTFYHPTDCIDIGGVNISGNNQVFQAGVIPIAYNIGCHLPVFDDLWIITDAFIDNHAKFGAGLGIGTKF